MLRKATLKRTGFKQKANDGVHRPHKAFKSKARKQIDGYHDKRYTESCKGQNCYVKAPGICGGAASKSTVVPAHSNQLRHGKGVGIKAKDIFTVPACMYCHAFIDQSGEKKQIKFDLWDSAYERWRIDRHELTGLEND